AQPGVSYRTPELRSSSTPYGVVTERSFTPNCACGLFEVIHLKLLTEFPSKFLYPRLTVFVPFIPYRRHTSLMLLPDDTSATTFS
ncbi:MAG: hypothetical protein LBK58_15965, partial [Prevotellaceae bacterium]|nr:hypothetical protein [Prevotellaceae bacterium]